MWAAQGALNRDESRAWAAGLDAAGRVCRFVAGRLIAGHGRVALMVDGWNDPAIRLYRRLGLALQGVRAALTDPG